MRASQVVVLAGGTGGAKLARGMLDVVGPDRLTVIANTGDDIEIYGARVSPDPDLVAFWLADLIDARGWGLAGDTFAVMDALRALGVDVWFNLGDRDLAWCLQRRELEDDDGLRPTEAMRTLCERIGVAARVLPATDDLLTTFVNEEILQVFMIKLGGRGPVHEVHIDGAGSATPSPEALQALRDADAVIVGPSNPVISIWPILTALGRKALQAIEAPVVCVSPVVGGKIVKGPTAAFLDYFRQPISAAGVLAFYETVAPGLLDGIVADEETGGALPALRADTRMDDAAARARVAEQTLRFALDLG